MALDKEVLGLTLYNSRSAFSNKSPDELISEFGSLENARLEAAKADADEIIKHFINYIKLTIPATGFFSATPGSPVTGTSITGTIL